MQGYDLDKAIKAITESMDKKQYPEFANQFEALIRHIVELDFAFMRESGALGEDGMAGNTYYDDDEAFEYILDGIARERGWDEDKTLRLGALIDDYMEAQESYMESTGLLDWE